MAITINGTTGIAGVDGSAGTPAVQGTDTNTGVFYPAADTVGVSTGGSERVRVDSSGNVGIGTSSPSTYVANGGLALFNYYGTSSTALAISNNSGFSASNIARIDFRVNNSFNGNERIAAIWGINPNAGTNNGGALVFGVSANGTATTPSEAARIDSSGNLLVGNTGLSNSKFQLYQSSSGTYSQQIFAEYASGTGYFIEFLRRNSGTNNAVGAISASTTTTTYATSSDYRLKENIAPITGALTKISDLKPVTYKWKLDGSIGEGFIAHELAEIFPNAVVGEKDALDADGNPVYQGIDTSFLVATLTAAIQELKALVDTQASTITQLQADVAALKGTP